MAEQILKRIEEGFNRIDVRFDAEREFCTTHFDFIDAKLDAIIAILRESNAESRRKYGSPKEQHRGLNA